MSHSPVMTFVIAQFSQYSGLPARELLLPETTLGDVIARSPAMHNSIDLMEAFAKTANALKKQHGLRVRLPTFPLDTPMVRVLEAFEAQASAAPSAAPSAPPSAS